MFFSLKDIYIGKIYDITGFETKNSISDHYAAFVKVFNEHKKEYDYVMINRGRLNKNTFRFKHNTVFKQIDDIEFNLDMNFTFYYVGDLKPLINFIGPNDLKNLVTDFEIYMELYKININEDLKKVKVKG